jgi:hypothetical protein
MRPRKLTQRADNKRNALFIDQIIAELLRHPCKVDIIKQNMRYYRAQTHLKRGFLLAIERFDWVFEATHNVDEICAQIMAEDYIGNRLRRYPLLFKGVLAKD